MTLARATRQLAICCGLACMCTACGDAVDLERVEFEDEGVACLFAPTANGDLSPSQPQVFAVDAPVIVSVVLSSCIDACASDQVAECDAQVIDGRIVVSSHGGYTHDPRLADCSLICGRLAARCDLPPLARGRYDFVHGEYAHFLDVPGSYQRAPCIGPPTGAPPPGNGE